MKKSTDTPILRQYDEMKKKHPDAILLFRVGDSYEIYRNDSVTAASIIGGTVSRKLDAKGKRYHFMSFGHTFLDSYLPQLVRAGKRVAICEQIEPPRHAVNNGIVTEPNKNTQTPQTTMEDPKEEKQEEKQEEHRSPQMTTADGRAVTHAHAFQSKDNPDAWYWTARIDGEKLKPQRMADADVASYREHSATVEQMMQRYFPTKIAAKVDMGAVPFTIESPGQPSISVEKFAVYKEKKTESPDFDKWMFFARIDGTNMSEGKPTLCFLFPAVMPYGLRFMSWE